MTAAIAITTAAREGQKEGRDAVSSALSTVLRPEVLEARHQLAAAASRPQGVRASRSGEEFERNFREEGECGQRTGEACLLVMWTIQSVQPQVSRVIGRRSTADTEVAALYWHLGMLVRDLNRALENWGNRFRWDESGEQTNRALRALPVARGRWGGVVASPPTERIWDVEELYASQGVSSPRGDS